MVDREIEPRGRRMTWPRCWVTEESLEPAALRLRPKLFPGALSFQQHVTWEGTRGLPQNKCKDH